MSKRIPDMEDHDDDDSLSLVETTKKGRIPLPSITKFEPILGNPSEDTKKTKPLRASLDPTDPDKDIKEQIFEILNELEHTIEEVEKYKNPNQEKNKDEEKGFQVQITSSTIKVDSNANKDDKGFYELPDETDTTREEFMLTNTK
jgi:hypothetical protein